MTRNKVLFVGLTVLILPFGGMLIARIFWQKNIFDNPDFWYGYMAYFGTVSLAIVSLLQSIKTEEISNNFMEQQLRQKIGYFELKENMKNMGSPYKYQPIQVGQFLNANCTNDHSKDKTMGIWMKNIGEDIILNMHSKLGEINGQIVSFSCSNNVVYKNEEIVFELDNTRCFQEKNLKIEFCIEMKNTAGIHYNQSIHISAEKSNATEQGTYIIQEFDTCVNFN